MAVGIPCVLVFAWRGLGTPAAFYHFAFEAGSPPALEDKRRELIDKGVQVTDVVDHGWAKSTYMVDPNGILVELCKDDPGFVADEETALRMLREPVVLDATTSDQ